MKDKFAAILSSALSEISNSSDTGELEEIRIKYFGKKGEITQILKTMGSLSKEERPVIGKIANEIGEEIKDAIERAKSIKKTEEINRKLMEEVIDVTLPGDSRCPGGKHPVMNVLDDLKDIFIGMGFNIAEGPEIETVYNNFDALNSPPDHPSRSMSDTFYVSDSLLLRTQTSPVQIRTMKTEKPPIRIVSPGRCFRFDELDATHSPMFHQLEGLVIDKNITVADLKGTLDVFAKRLFGADTMTKFRPHYFPFTEPSAEVDVTCFKCGGKGCRMCKNTGWIEILGCGMVHPNVIKNCGLDPAEYNGFAFGMGLDRITMLKYGIDDIRHMFENDIRFLSQFI